MGFDSPPIVKLAERAMSEIELAVARWPRAHRYQHGSVLRDRAMKVAELAHRAWRSRGELTVIEQLVDAVDSLKLALQIGANIRAFSSFRQFEAIARVATDLGRQCGGWLKQRREKGQNAAASRQPQRSQILSPHAAPRANA